MKRQKTRKTMPDPPASEENPAVFIQLGHSDKITCLALSPDGKYVLSGSYDHTLRLWDTDSGRMIRQFEIGPEDVVTSVTFSPDGKYALSGSREMMGLWKMDSGRNVQSFEKDEPGSPQATAFSPDGQYALKGIGRGVGLYETFSGKKLRTFTTKAGLISSVACSADGKYVMAATSSPFDETVVWDADTGEEIRSLRAGKQTVFSTDGKYAIDDSYRGVRLWDMASGKDIRIGKDEYVMPLAISSDNKYVLFRFAYYGTSMKLTEVSSEKEISSFHGHEGKITAAVLSADGKYVVSGGMDKTIRLWDAASGKEIRSFQGNLSGHVCCAAFSPDGRYALAGYENNVLMLWDMKSGKGVRSFRGHAAPVTSVTFSGGARYALSGSKDGTMRLWHTDSGKELRRIKGYTSISNALLSPDGKYVLTGGRLSDPDSGKLIRFYENDSGYPLAFSPDSRYVIFAVKDVLWLRDAASGKDIRSFEGHLSAVRCAGFSPDGRYLLSGSQDKTLKLWDAVSGSQLRSFEGHSHAVTSAAFSPDGQYALSGSEDNFLKLWEVSSGREIFKCKGDSDAVTPAAFSPDGQYALFGSHDKSLSLWGLGSEKELCRFVLFGDGEWVTITRQGYYTASAQGHKYLYTNVRGTVCEIEKYRKSLDDTGKVRKILSKSEKIPMGRSKRRQGAEPVLSSARKYRAEKVSRHTLKVYGRKTRREVFSHTIKEDAYGGVHRDYGDGRDFTSVNDYAISPDEKYVLLVIEDNHCGLDPGDERIVTSYFQVFEISTGKPVSQAGSPRKFESARLGSVNHADFSADGKRIIVSSGSTIVVWDFETGKIVKNFTPGLSGSKLRKKAQERKSEKKKAQVSPKRPRKDRGIQKPAVPVVSMDFSDNGKYILSSGPLLSSGDEYAWLNLWDASSGEFICSFEPVHGIPGFLEKFFMSSPKNLAFLKKKESHISASYLSPDGKYFLIGCHTLWDIIAVEKLGTFRKPHNSAMFSPDGKRALFLRKSAMILWDMVSSQPVRSFEGDHRETFRFAAFVSRGRGLMCVEPDRKTIELRDALSGEDIRSFRMDYKGISFGIRSAAFSPDGRYGLARMHDGRTQRFLSLWEISSGKQISLFRWDSQGICLIILNIS